MKKRVGVRVLWVLVFVFILSNCQREDFAKRDPIDVPAVTAPTPAIAWDWETASDWMETLVPNSIPKPWAGTSILYDPVIRYDYKSVDGWSLLYNNFNPTQVLPPDPYFALYNKYRGLLRFYFYIPSNSYVYSNYLEENITASGTSATTTAFSGSNQEIIDLNVGRNYLESIKPYAIPSSGGWYVSQFQMAYDKDLSSKTFTNIGLYMNLMFWSVTDEKLAGTSVGSAKGEIRSESTTLNAIANATAKAAFAVINTENLPASLAGLAGIIDDVASDGASAVIEGIGNLMFSGTHDETQQVDLAITLDTRLDGTATTPGNLKTNLAIVMPGTSNATSATGFNPVDNRKMGVFGLPVRPTVKVHSTTVTGHICEDVVSNHYVTYTAQLDAATLAYLNKTNADSFNQELFGGASPAATTGTIHYDILGPGTYDAVCGGENIEEIGGQYLANWDNGEKGISTFNTSTMIMYVRVYFDVIPTDGSPKTTFVRTYRANAVTF